MDATVPNKENATVAEAKMIDYLLNERHLQGRAKARFFRRMGYDETNLQRFASDLRSLLDENAVKTMRHTPFGVHCVVEGAIRTPSQRSVEVDRLDCRLPAGLLDRP